MIAFDPRNRAPSFAERPALYDAAPERRFQSAAELAALEPTRELVWPFSYRGAANAWLVFIGPSAGGSKEQRDAASDPWRGSETARYGHHAAEVTFGDGPPYRNVKWRALRCAAFEAAGADSDTALRLQARLSAIMNLGFENAAVADLGRSHYERRCAGFSEFLLPRLAEARPAAIVILSKAAWDPFEDAARRANRIVREYKLVVPHPIPSKIRKDMKRMLVRVADDLPYPTAVILSPVHPSMAFSPQHDAPVIRSPLADLLRDALRLA